MKIAYLSNTYPVTSATFIRREINALERLGVTVERFAVREWDQDLVDPLDQVEKSKTEYLLSGNTGGLLKAFLKELVFNPAGLFSAATTALRMAWNLRDEFVAHAAYLLEAVYLKQRLLERNVEHLHCHFGTNPAAIALLVKKLGGIPYSFTAHGPDEFTNHHRFNFDIKIREAKFVVAISSYCRSILISLSGMDQMDKIEIVHCGLDLEAFTPTPIPDNKQVVCVGRLSPQKAQELIVRAFRGVVDKEPQAKLVLVGDGESRAAVEKARDNLGLQDHVELAGWMENARVRETISDSRIFLLPSFAEGLPVVLMESLAMRRPPITTYIAGIPELVDGTCGWLVPASSVEAITEAVLEALGAPLEELEKKAEIGYLRVQDQHDVDQEAAKLLRRIKAS